MFTIYGNSDLYQFPYVFTIFYYGDVPYVLPFLRFFPWMWVQNGRPFMGLQM